MIAMIKGNNIRRTISNFKVIELVLLYLLKKIWSKLITLIFVYIVKVYYVMKWYVTAKRKHEGYNFSSFL